MRLVMKIEEINFNCLVKCCGVAPEYNPRGAGFYCPACKNEKFGWGGTIVWHAGLWNTSFHRHTSSGGRRTDQPFITTYQPSPFMFDKGWLYAKLHMSFHLPWSEDKTANHDFVLFQCVDRPVESLLKSERGYEYVIDDTRCLSSLQLMSLDGRTCELTIPKLKGPKPVYAYVFRSWCTDGTWNYGVQINTHNRKWRDKTAETLAEIGVTFPDF